MSGRDSCNSNKPAAALPPRPQWLADEPEVLALLHVLLDMLDKKPLSERARPPGIRLEPKLVPQLFRHDEAADRSWKLLQDLEGQVLEIRSDRKRAPFDPPYVNAMLRLLEAGEGICRAWLDRPRQQPYREEWASAVAARAEHFADRGECLRQRPLRVAQKSAAEVVAAFAGLSRYVDSNLTLRQLSARCFWGLSKLLDARADVVAQSFPELQIAPRPVLVHVHLPQNFSGVLFIENQDSYVQALGGQPAAVQGLALVYGAGFRGSAERVRAAAGVRLHYHGPASTTVQARFEGWWLGEQAAPWPVWFWGDLDYSGMAILKVLRQRFGDVQAWLPGYAPLLQLLRDGEGHSPDAADKTEQIDPGSTGCRFADEELLPAIRRLGRFVDQEIV